MNHPRDCIYREVYVITVDSIVQQTAGRLEVHLSFENLVESLSKKSHMSGSEIRVLHGILTPARVVPSRLRGRQAFIIIVDEDSKYGSAFDSDADDSCDELAAEIEAIANNSDIRPDIDDIFILYGYELGLTLSVSEDDINEDVMQRCAAVGLESRKILRAWGNNESEVHGSSNKG
jgi:hypothetical protein